MSASTYFVSEAALRHLKKKAASRIVGVSSSHLSEGVAAAIGFKTHASLRAALAGRATVEAEKPSNQKLAARLRELGYHDVPDTLHVLPELDCSYTPFRTPPLRQKRGVRWTAWRNLMVGAINAGLERRLFGLSPNDNWWPGFDPKDQYGARFTYHFKFAGDIPASASVRLISGGELSIEAALNLNDPALESFEWEGTKNCDAFASCWLERQLGAWIQDGGEDFSCRRTTLPGLASTSIDPIGYSDQGSFIM